MTESYVSKSNNIGYNNAYIPLSFEDLPSLRDYHSGIMSLIKDEFSEQFINSHCVLSKTAAPPGSLAITMRIMMQYLFE